jgi:hypothetical protein
MESAFGVLARWTRPETVRLYGIRSDQVAAKFMNFGDKVGVWKGVGCGLIAAFGRECCSWFPLRLPEAG